MDLSFILVIMKSPNPRNKLSGRSTAKPRVIPDQLDSVVRRIIELAHESFILTHLYLVVRSCCNTHN